MVNDVETILREIREHVREEQQSATHAALPDGHERNGSSSSPMRVTRNETIERLRAHLTTTARAWDRLPPVYSYRTGVAARLELWIKARFKEYSRWFVWEQVNFNAATHHALSDAAELLAAQQDELSSLRAQVETNRSEQHEQNARTRAEFEAKHRVAFEEIRAALEAKHRAAGEEMRAQLSHLESRLSGLRDDLHQEQARLTDQLREFGELREQQLAKLSKIDSRLVELANDLREEQRVCFKQLSLAVSEATVLEDRGRRAIEARIEKLENRRPDKA
jgi:hypothetical protein